jgi:aspartyl/asparaginyl beta-hydroxylase (cupin superfamily)
MYPGLTAQPWHDPRQFPIATALEKAADEIAAELRGLNTKQFLDEAEQIARVGRWSVLFLAQRGVKCDDVCSMCPATASVLDAHQDETLLAGVTYFSCLDPGTHVAPHRGPTNTRLRCHLGIEVPDDCGLKVGGIAGAWERGRCVVFDDSFVHEVWNRSPSRRVVLIVDIWHPELTRDEIALLQWMAT